MNRLLIIDAVSTKKMLAHFSGVYNTAPAERVRLHDKTTSRPRRPVHGPAGAVPSATLNRRGARTGQRDPATGPRSPRRTITPKQVHRKERHRFPGRPLHEQPIRRHRVTQPRSDDAVHPTSLGRHRSLNHSMAASNNTLLQPLTTTCTHIFTTLVYYSTTVLWPPRQFCTP